MSGSRLAMPLAVAMLLLAGCAVNAPRAAAPGAILPAPQAQDQARWFAAHPDWSFQGRLAVSHEGKGGNGRIDWTQRGQEYAIELSAPITRQTWRLSGDTQHRSGTLEGLQGGPRHGEDAQALLREATGWEIPLALLPDWVRGLPAGDGYGSAPRGPGTDGSVPPLGWTVEYQQWHPGEDGRPPLPRRIEARKGQAKVRLMLDRWDFPAYE